MHTAFTHQSGNVQLEVLSHYSESADHDAVLVATKAKAALIDDKLPSLVQTAVDANVSLNSPSLSDGFVPYRLALIDAGEPILYLAGTGSFAGQEIHVYLTPNMDYEYSELFDL
jgi:hypothetical protein